MLARLQTKRESIYLDTGTSLPGMDIFVLLDDTRADAILSEHESQVETCWPGSNLDYLLARMHLQAIGQRTMRIELC